MFTDMVGYTALSQKNEGLAMKLLEEQRRVLRSFFPKHNGREVKTMGDGSLVEFESALEAVRCAFEIQRSLYELNSGRPTEGQIPLRVGIHLGDVIHDQRDVYGDAVNIASRIEPLAAPGGICLTEQVHDQIKNKLELPLISLGRKELKNVGGSIEVFKVLLPWEGQTEKTREFDVRRVAILPFTSLSPDPDDAFFADGVTEEIISTASGISGLEVISRTSVMGYKGTAKKVKEIGKELDAGSILEGSFRKAGNRIRVTAQLIDVAGDRHVWAQSYDKELDDVFAIQIDIAKQVAEALKVKILRPEMGRLERKPTTSTSAYASYLRGRYHWNKRGLEDIRKAMDYFKEAIREDENFALGYAGLADCHEILMGNWGVEREENRRKAKEFLTKALDLEPDLAEAHATMGLGYLNEYKFREAEREFQRAIELKPSYASAHQWYMHALFALSRYDEAFREIEKAAELDPLSEIINNNLASCYFWRRDYEKALEIGKEGVELAPSDYSPHFALALYYGRLKMFDNAKTEGSLAVKLAGDTIPSAEAELEVLLARLRGDRSTVKRLLSELERQVGTPGGPALAIIAGYYFWLGDVENGFKRLERSVSERDTMLYFLKNEEMFDGVRGTPRFVEILRRVGLDPALP